MNETTNKKKSSKIIDIIIIIILVLSPGIRGYSNWNWYEYIIILIPIAGVIYHWIKE